MIKEKINPAVYPSRIGYNIIDALEETLQTKGISLLAIVRDINKERAEKKKRGERLCRTDRGIEYSRTCQSCGRNRNISFFHKPAGGEKSHICITCDGTELILKAPAPTGTKICKACLKVLSFDKFGWYSNKHYQGSRYQRAICKKCTSINAGHSARSGQFDPHKYNTETGERKCSICKEWKPWTLAFFYASNRYAKPFALMSTCKKCHNAKNIINNKMRKRKVVA